QPANLEAFADNETTAPSHQRDYPRDPLQLDDDGSDDSGDDADDADEAQAEEGLGSNQHMPITPPRPKVHIPPLQTSPGRAAKRAVWIPSKSTPF
ncbi:hypothetical protein BGX27_004566, partial [Mortierella sp. AM989]